MTQLNFDKGNGGSRPDCYQPTWTQAFHSQTFICGIVKKCGGQSAGGYREQQLERGNKWAFKIPCVAQVLRTGALKGGPNTQHEAPSVSDSIIKMHL